LRVVDTLLLDVRDIGLKLPDVPIGGKQANSRRSCTLRYLKNPGRIPVHTQILPGFYAKSQACSAKTNTGLEPIQVVRLFASM
jgi:hypothetical protein